MREQGLGVRNVEFLGNSARSELGQQGVETTDRPDPLDPNVVIALGQQTEHLCMIGRLDGSKSWGAQGGDGDRMGIVGVVLVRPLGGEHPDA
jgi:hypothetical protein